MTTLISAAREGNHPQNRHDSFIHDCIRSCATFPPRPGAKNVCRTSGQPATTGRYPLRAVYAI
eukprot:12043050-Heterocapsa_arctica.AAC.1